MYGYEKIVFSMETPRRMLYEVTILAWLMVLLSIQIKLVSLSTSESITILLGIIGFTLATDSIFLQIKQSIKRQLEVDAIKDINSALNSLINESAIGVVLGSSFVVKPNQIPPLFWVNKVSEKHLEALKATQKIREAYGTLYSALESHEIAIIHLEHLYRYFTIKIDQFVETIDTASSNMINASLYCDDSEEAYTGLVQKEFSEIQALYSDIASYSMDLRKILQNELLGDVFDRKLLPREPKEGYGTTLEKVATVEAVMELVGERDKELLGILDKV